ncbi:MAG: hypothetical protein FD188_3360, partial [Ignavibacteria bacterium]
MDNQRLGHHEHEERGKEEEKYMEAQHSGHLRGADKISNSFKINKFAIIFISIQIDRCTSTKRMTYIAFVPNFANQ